MHEETTYNVKFIHVDCSDLKRTLVEHTKEWQRKLTELLKKKALDELHSILSFFEMHSMRLKEVPQTLGELGSSINLVEKLQQDCKLLPERFAPLNRMFHL